MTTMRILAVSLALGFVATSGLDAAGANATQASDASLSDLSLRSTVRARPGNRRLQQRSTRGNQQPGRRHRFVVPERIGVAAVG